MLPGLKKNEVRRTSMAYAYTLQQSNVYGTLASVVVVVVVVFVVIVTSKCCSRQHCALSCHNLKFQCRLLSVIVTWHLAQLPTPQGYRARESLDIANSMKA